jgi:alpha-L-rhamnosidase
MKLLSRTISLGLISALIPSQVSSQQNPELLNRRWKAAWIASPDTSRREFGVFHFRKTFSLQSVPARFVIHASGDNRYELFINGARVLAGPARGDLNHWRYETIDIGQHLRAGKNVIAAVAWNFADQSPVAQMSHETGLIVQGDTDAESAVNTDASWKVIANNAISMIPPDRRKFRGYLAVGPGERVDGLRYDWGWETIDFDDSSWKQAVTISVGGPRGIQDSPSRWMLVPRSLPLMEEKTERIIRIARASGIKASDDFLRGRGPLTVPANTHATLLLDQTYLTTAYPELLTSGGRGAEIKLTYAEALLKGREKGNRNEIEGKEIAGYEDRFISDGGSRRLFRPLWWRTFRYLQLDIETKSELLVMEDLRAIYTAYPFALRAKFETDDPALEKIWEVGWRTARLCAHETYMDCPYYEQLQYAGDTRIQALVSLYLTSDDRLVKNAIEQLDESRTPEGLTQSRYPSALPQYIPPFSLLWIGMMHDLWWTRGESQFLRQFLQNSRGVLAWFESRLTTSGLLGQLQWWNFVDWTEDFKSGVPPQEADGRSAILTFQFASALREQADLESSFGSSERAEHYRSLAAKINEAVRKECWDRRDVSWPIRPRSSTSLSTQTYSRS